MYQLVCILLFSSISIANFVAGDARIVTVNITEVQDEYTVKCISEDIQEKLTDGEQIQLVANVPYDTDTYMWCYDGNQNVLTAHCNFTGNQCTHLFQFSSSMQGRWQCIYLMDTNTTIDPTEYYNGKSYTKAICELNFVAAENTSVSADMDANRKKLECVSQNIERNFVYGEQFPIVANTPYNIEYMWCDVDRRNVLVAGCNNVGNQCTSAVRFSPSHRGRWHCTYLMDTKGMVEPNVYVNGIKKYTKVTCEQNFKAVGYRTVTADIKLVDNGTKVECVSRNKEEKLIDGESVRIVVNVPYRIQSMTCQNDEQNLIATRCVQTGNECYSALHFTATLQGRWECSYLLKTNGQVEPIVNNRNGRKVTKATCQLNLEAINHREVTMDIKVTDNGTK